MKKSIIKDLSKQVCPPMAWEFLRFIKNISMPKKIRIMDNPTQQDLDIYWDEAFADGMETWGTATAWNEIQFLMIHCRGKVLDIACGTGSTIEILSGKFQDIVMYGCDISDLLIGRAMKKGIPAERLKVCDATRTGYDDNYFDHAYSIGSLEHFTEEGIANTIKECCRMVKGAVFHQIPVSRSGKNEGWLKTPAQSYFNNNVDWWLSKFKPHYEVVRVLDSAWNDDLQISKWFIGKKRKEADFDFGAGDARPQPFA